MKGQEPPQRLNLNAFEPMSPTLTAQQLSGSPEHIEEQVVEACCAMRSAEAAGVLVLVTRVHLRISTVHAGEALGSANDLSSSLLLGK